MIRTIMNKKNPGLAIALEFNGVVYTLGEHHHHEKLGNVKVTRNRIGNIGFWFDDYEGVKDVIVDTDYNMHAEFYYDNMLKGIHFGLEFWDGEDIDWFVESSETDKSLLDIIADHISECRFSSWPEDDPSYLADDYYDND